jgi:hypothetical protein
MTNIISFGWFKPNELSRRNGLWSENEAGLRQKKEMIAIMSDEYSKYYTEPANSILEKMWQATVEFQENLPARKGWKEIEVLAILAV